MSLRRAQACSEGSKTSTTSGLPRGRGRTCAAHCIHINARRRDTTGPGMPGPYRDIYAKSAVPGNCRGRRFLLHRISSS